jgi:hypothetical protein
MKAFRCVLALAALLLASGCASDARAVGGLADLAVYDRAEGRVLPVHWHQGKAYIVGRPGNEYQVVLKNRGGGDVLAVVSVDGVNVITGETADPSQSGYVLSPYRALELRGWRKSLAETAAFYFTSLGDSYAARTGRPQDVGVIGVALFRRKQAEPPPAPISQGAPRTESRMQSRMDETAASRAEPQLGTGHGRRENSPAQYVQFERATVAPTEVITLYYDSYRNLVARGVIREGTPVAPLPRPFPGFVPDPRG